MRSEARAWRRLARVVVAFALACLTRAMGAEAVPVERVLAAVDGVPVLLSEVRLVEALRGVSRADALQAAIDERLMFQEAARLSQAAPGDDEAERAFHSLLASSPRAASLPEAGLRRLAARQAAILAYVEFRFRPQVRVGEDELRAEWAQEGEGGAAASDEGYAAAAPELRERLERRELDERIEAWVRELRAAAEVRLTPGAEAAP